MLFRSPDQTLALQVSKVTRDFIQLTWLEKKYTGLPPRVVTLPIDVRPSVRYVLFGQLPDSNAADSKKQPEAKAAKRTNGLKIPPPTSDAPAGGPPARVAATPAAPAKPAPEAAPSAPVSKGVAANPPAPKDMLANSPAPKDMLPDTPEPAPPSSLPAPEKSPSPPQWERAMGMLNNLVKLGEARK